MRSNAVKLAVISMVMLPLLLLSPQRSQAITGEDGPLWVQVNLPGFGSNNNMSVVAMAEYNGYLLRHDQESAGGN